MVGYTTSQKNIKEKMSNGRPSIIDWPVELTPCGLGTPYGDIALRQYCLRAASLHMASSPNEFSWYHIFADWNNVFPVWHFLCQKLDDGPASLMRSRHLISNTTYSADQSQWTAIHEFGISRKSMSGSESGEASNFTNQPVV